MAESYGGSGMRSDYDDTIKQALKAELEQLKASDELKAETLRRCSAEISADKKSKSFFTGLMQRRVMRYGATIAAACLLILVFFVNFPGLFGLQSDKNSTQAPRAELSGDSAARAGNETTAGRVPNSKGDDRYAAQGAPSIDADPAASAAPAPSPEMPNGDRSFMLMESMHVSSLNSMNSGSLGPEDREYGSDQAVDGLIVSYNKALGTNYTFDENTMITVSSLLAEGVDMEMLRNASGYAELLGGGSYRILPLKDQSGNYAALLPLFTEPYDKSAPEEENAYAVSDASMPTCPAPSLPVDAYVIDAMLDRTGIENALKDAFGSARITELVVADINYGSDYLALITADGNEYAVPLFMSFSVNSLQNGQAYDIRYVFDSLARYLETGE